MKISNRGRYGIRFLIDLAEKSESPHVSLASAGKRKKISIRYLEQVAVILRRAGYIRSVKGAFGGYTLTKPPEEINIGEVLRVLEGDMLVADPPLPGARETIFRRHIRAGVYKCLNERIAGVIDNYTLASLIKQDKSNTGYMYFI